MGKTNDTAPEDDDKIPVCVNCGYHAIRKRSPGKFGGVNRAPGKKWWCTNCKTGFDKPEMKERDSSAISNNYAVTPDQISAARETLGIEEDEDERGSVR